MSVRYWESQWLILTNSCNDLSLDTKLVGEATSEIRDATFSIACDVWNLSNVVVHMSTREHQDENQTDRSPNVAVLNDWQGIGVCHCSECEDANQNRHCCSKSGPVEWPGELRVASRRHMSNDPIVHTFRSLRTEEIESNRLSIRFGIFAHRGRKE